MALGLARDQSSDCTNPVLVFYAYDKGFLADVVSLEFQIFDVSTPAKQITPVQVFPAGPGRQSVNLDPCDATPTPGHRLGLGRYVAEYTVDTAEPIGDHRIVWYVTREAGGTEETYEQEFQVLVAGEVTAPGLYCTLNSLRAEGLSDCAADDMRLFKAIKRSSEFIERVTGRKFGPHYMTKRLNGRGGPYLLLGDPIIAVESIEVNSFPFDPEPDFIFSNESIRVYNRHIELGETNPDDRNNPKLEIFRGDRNLHFTGDPSTHYFADVASIWFPNGQQNVIVKGVFGYTDPDGSTVGKIPADIELACALLTIRNVVQLTDPERAQQNYAWRITQEKTRQQSVSYGNLSGKAASMAHGFFTGDPEVDAILAAYMRPPSLGAA